MAQSPLRVSSFYSSGQCLLSVLGSIGVILLFAGIPQLIYAPSVNAASMVTFLVGAMLITFMVAGNAYMNHRYRRAIQDHNEVGSTLGGTIEEAPEDKPPSYDDLLKGEIPPPPYSCTITEKPPRYEDVAKEASNWHQIGLHHEASYTNGAFEVGPLERGIMPIQCGAGYAPYGMNPLRDKDILASERHPGRRRATSIPPLTVVDTFAAVHLPPTTPRVTDEPLQHSSYSSSHAHVQLQSSASLASSGVVTDSSCPSGLTTASPLCPDSESLPSLATEPRNHHSLNLSVSLAVHSCPGTDDTRHAGKGSGSSTASFARDTV